MTLKKLAGLCLALCSIPSLLLARVSVDVPDASSSALLLVISAAGFIAFRRFFRR